MRYKKKQVIYFRPLCFDTKRSFYISYSILILQQPTSKKTLRRFYLYFLDLYPVPQNIITFFPTRQLFSWKNWVKITSFLRKSSRLAEPQKPIIDKLLIKQFSICVHWVSLRAFLLAKIAGFVRSSILDTKHQIKTKTRSSGRTTGGPGWASISLKKCWPTLVSKICRKKKH